jgi:hypothetical protein
MVFYLNSVLYKSSLGGEGRVGLAEDADLVEPGRAICFTNLPFLRHADKTEYMVMSRGQNSGQSHRIKIDSSSFENVEEFKYLGTTITNQNSFLEEIKS